MAAQESNGTETSHPDEQKQSDVDVAFNRIEQIKNEGNNYFKKKEYHDAITRYDIAIEEYKTFIQTDYDKNATESLKKMKQMLGSIYNNRAFAYFRLEMFGQVCCLNLFRNLSDISSMIITHKNTLCSNYKSPLKTVLDTTMAIKLKFFKVSPMRKCALFH